MEWFKRHRLLVVFLVVAGVVAGVIAVVRKGQGIVSSLYEA